MFDLKKEKRKKNIFLTLSVISGILFLAGALCKWMGDKSPIKFIIDRSPVEIIIPPMSAFFITLTLYRNSKKAITENQK